MNETLEEMARALFKSWFVDFDPVRAKAARQAARPPASLLPCPGAKVETAPRPRGEWTLERACAYLDAMNPHIVDLFPDRLVPSELGEIPEGWELSGAWGGFHASHHGPFL